jgi:hypothetical protein
MRLLSTAALALLLTVVEGCAGGDGQVGTAPRPGKPAPVGGIGGTGLAQGPGGIGGTGLKDWGIISPNGIGGTGIVGIVTGHGSIWVNGLEVEIAPGAHIEQDGQPIPAALLAVGDLVAVQAQGDGPQPIAQAVAVVPVLQGPVQEAERATGKVKVLGQTVRIGQETRLREGGFPAIGQSIRVHGLLRADGTVEASSIAPASGGSVRLTGTLERRESGWMAAGVPLRLEAGTAVSAQAGKPVIVIGTWDGTAILAESVQPDPFSALLERVSQVSLQGYLLPVGAGAALRAGGAQVRLSAPAGLIDPSGGERLVVTTGILSPDRKVAVTAIRVMERMFPPASSSSPRGSDQQPGADRGTEAIEAPPLKPPFAGSGNPWGGPPAVPPRGPPPGKGPPCGTPPCGGPPPGKGK